MNNIAVIIGGDHHNGLNLARILGRNSVEVHAIIISNKNYSFMAKSKYISHYRIFSHLNKALDYLTKEYSKESNKVVVFPYSDNTAQLIDSNFEQLKDDFIIQSIKSKQGLITKYMNKYEQYKLAKQFGIRITYSLFIDLENNSDIDYFNWKYPCILKPVLSTDGNKLDIRICKNLKEAENAILELKSKQYKRIFYQEFIDFDYEVVLVGSIGYSTDNIFFTANRVIRNWPPQKGTSSFSTLCQDDNILKQSLSLLKKIQEIGYKGLIDVELFVKNGIIYLNEINWRNSGGDFRNLSSGFDYAYWWYCDAIGKKCVEKWTSPRESYSMVEFSDIRQVLTRRISFRKWLSDLKKCRNFSMYFKVDLKPFVYRIWYKLREIIL